MVRPTAACFLVCWLVSTSTVKCAKILGVFPSPGYSQFILGEKLMCELVKRGHNVTIISPYKPKSCMEKCRTILTEDLLDLVRDEDLFLSYGSSAFELVSAIHELGFLLTSHILANEGVQKLIVDPKEAFDLVITEKFVNEAHMAFAKHFNAPLILFSSVGPSEWTHPHVGYINLPSIMPIAHSSFTTYMNFYQRLMSTVYSIYDTLYWRFIALPKQQEYLDKYFPGKIQLDDIIYNVSLVLLNSDVSTTETFHLPSNMIEVGGFHIQPKQLPDDIRDFLNGAEDGAIFFSMGSNLNSTRFGEERLNAILKVFSKLKQRVVWKFEDNLKNKPDNVLISRWLPQSDILGHPNIRLFITHAGLLSTTETVYYGVPVVAIPIFGDQRMNTARIVKHGFGIQLPFDSIDEENLRSAITKVLEDPSYQKQARKRSNILRDQIVRPMERAMFWIEYVLRHQGAPHLRTSSVDLYWYQLYLLDVVFFVIFIIFIFFVMVRYSIRTLYATRVKVPKPKNTTRKKQKKQ